MWILFGVSAVVTTFLNVARTLMGKNAEWLRFISVSLTALTLCAFYSMNSAWVLTGDVSALEDVVPDLSIMLWVFTAASILVNSISLLWKKN